MTNEKKIFFRSLAGGFLALALLWTWNARSSASDKKTVTIGYFPNVTHAQALIGRANGAFDKALGPDASIDWKVFNAGPSAIEAMFAGKLDITTIGPSPAINAYVKSEGDAVRIVAGAASGGAALVVRADEKILSPTDFQNKKIAAPQLGNTQDVALRSWLSKNGLKLKGAGGNVDVMPVANADELTLFSKKALDAAWTVEPWVSLLAADGGKVFLDEASLWPDGRYATTVVLVRRKFLEENPAVVRRFLAAHAALTDWINAHPDEAKKIVGTEIEKLSHKALPDAVLASAFSRLHFTTDLMQSSISEQGKAAYRAGYLRKEPELGGLFDPKPLEEAKKS